VIARHFTAIVTLALAALVLLERDGGGDRHRRCVLQGPRLRRLALTGAPADLDPKTAPSSARYRSAAIATCASNAASIIPTLLHSGSQRADIVGQWIENPAPRFQ